MNALPASFQPLVPVPVLYRSLEAEALVLDSNFSHVVMTNSNGMDPVTLSINEFKSLWGTEITIRRQSRSIPRKLDLSAIELLEVRRIEVYVKRLARLTNNGIGGVKVRKRVIEIVSQELGDSKGMTPATLARYAKDYYEESSGVAKRITAGKTRTRRSKFPSYIFDLALQVLEDGYLCSSPMSVSACYKRFLRKSDLGGITYEERPSESTFQAWVRDLDIALVAEKQSGFFEAKKVRRNAASPVTVNRILDRVEVDACHLAIGIVDGNGRFIGTVTIFVVFCCFSRSVLGVHVQIGRGESAPSVIDSYRHAICPKGNIPYLKNKWTQHGIPHEIISDGGSGYTATKTQSFLAQNNIQSRIVSAGSGWKKPYIERFFGHLRKDLASQIRSYCGRMDDKKDPGDTVEKRAELTLVEFRELLTGWIVDVYHQQPKKALGNRTPQQVWDECAAFDPPFVPSGFEIMMMPTGQRERRKISGDAGHQGIVINNVRYNDTLGHLKEMHNMMVRRGHEPYVDCDYNPNDISAVSVIHPITQEAFLIPSVLPLDSKTCLATFKSENPSSYITKAHVEETMTEDLPGIKTAKLQVLSSDLSPARVLVSEEQLLNEITDAKAKKQNEKEKKTKKSKAPNNNVKVTPPKDSAIKEGYDYE